MLHELSNSELFTELIVSLEELLKLDEELAFTKSQEIMQRSDAWLHSDIENSTDRERFAKYSVAHLIGAEVVLQAEVDAKQRHRQLLYTILSARGVNPNAG